MPIRVLIVDDSALMRRALTALLISDPEIEVVGTAADGRAAIEQVVTLRPDVITMDVRMPVLDGAQTTEHIMAYYPTPILVLTASLSSFDIDITFRMLGLGALDVMEKPSSADPNGLQQARAELIKRVKLLSRVRVVTHLRGRRRGTEDTQPRASTSDTGRLRRNNRGSRTLPSPTTHRQTRGLRPPTGTLGSSKHQDSTPLNRPLTSTETLRRSHGARLLQPEDVVSVPMGRTSLGAAERLIVIGASTGGPRVVQHILRELPESLPASVLLVQHIADGFAAGLVDWLASSCRLPVVLAKSGDVAVPGRVFVAPDNLHLLIDTDGVLGVSSQPALLQRPSVDVTMQRAAEAYRSRTIGVLLTGMGRDGAAGMAAIYREGGHTIAQNGETCVVYGMPKAAVEAGVVLETLNPESIAGRLQMLLRDSFAKERR